MVVPLKSNASAPRRTGWNRTVGTARTSSSSRSNWLRNDWRAGWRLRSVRVKHARTILVIVDMGFSLVSSCGNLPGQNVGSAMVHRLREGNAHFVADHDTPLAKK